MNAREIAIPVQNGSMNAYLSLPPKGKGPGILLIQEIFGVNEHIRQVADQYAMDGYTVLAPDLFWRTEPGIQLHYDESGFQRGLGILGRLDFPLTLADLSASAKVLRALPEVAGKVASLGFCMGGALSYLLASTPGAVDAAVCYYGGGIQNQLDKADSITQPILMHFAENDGYIPMTAVADIQARFQAHSQAEIHTYPEVDHGFNCWGRGMYQQKAASLARGRTLEFLSRHISA